jgi:hypothetical protein
MNYKQSQYLRVEHLIKNGIIFNNDTGHGVFKKKSYPFILNDNNNNLVNQYRSSIIDYFYSNKLLGGMGN